MLLVLVESVCLIFYFFVGVGLNDNVLCLNEILDCFNMVISSVLLGILDSVIVIFVFGGRLVFNFSKIFVSWDVLFEGDVLDVEVDFEDF